MNNFICYIVPIFFVIISIRVPVAKLNFFSNVQSLMLKWWFLFWKGLESAVKSEKQTKKCFWAKTHFETIFLFPRFFSVFWVFPEEGIIVFRISVTFSALCTFWKQISMLRLVPYCYNYHIWYVFSCSMYFFNYQVWYFRHT